MLVVAPPPPTTVMPSAKEILASASLRTALVVIDCRVPYVGKWPSFESRTRTKLQPPPVGVELASFTCSKTRWSQFQYHASASSLRASSETLVRIHTLTRGRACASFCAQLVSF